MRPWLTHISSGIYFLYLWTQKALLLFSEVRFYKEKKNIHSTILWYFLQQVIKQVDVHVISAIHHWNKDIYTAVCSDQTFWLNKRHFTSAYIEGNSTGTFNFMHHWDMIGSHSITLTEMTKKLSPSQLLRWLSSPAVASTSQINRWSHWNWMGNSPVLLQNNSR